MRDRDQRIDLKIGATIRMQRLEMGMSQSELGKALGGAFNRYRNMKMERTRSPRRA
jgi:transcriptional regulator with XRE-family HTH domain